MMLWGYSRLYSQESLLAKLRVLGIELGFATCKSNTLHTVTVALFLFSLFLTVYFGGSTAVLRAPGVAILSHSSQ